jgi:hypothetical protein
MVVAICDEPEGRTNRDVFCVQNVIVHGEAHEQQPISRTKLTKLLKPVDFSHFFWYNIHVKV